MLGAPATPKEAANGPIFLHIAKVSKAKERGLVFSVIAMNHDELYMKYSSMSLLYFLLCTIILPCTCILPHTFGRLSLQLARSLQRPDIARAEREAALPPLLTTALSALRPTGPMFLTVSPAHRRLKYPCPHFNAMPPSPRAGALGPLASLLLRRPHQLSTARCRDELRLFIQVRQRTAQRTPSSAEGRLGPPHS